MKRSKYKGVYCLLGVNEKTTYSAFSHGDKPWRAQHRHKGVRWYGKSRSTERESALDYDKRMIELGLEPVNILKRK
jgi:hypothetical protein